MFIELAEILDCPECRDGYGLVAFVRESDQRRVVSGHLGCPICEIEFPIEHGAIALTESASPPDLARDETELPVKIAALLGLGEGAGSALLLGTSVGEHAAGVAGFADQVEVLAVVPSGTELAIDQLASGVNPVIGLTPRWPLRSGALDGVVLRGPVADAAVEARRCLRSGRRLVLIDPAPGDADALSQAGFAELARDEATWVGERR